MSDNAGGQTPSTSADKVQPSQSNASTKSGAAAPKPNPALRLLGIPNFRLRLPSRNWTIFLTIVGSWTGAVFYDRWQRKAAQKKWCTLVEHVAHESLPTTSLARRVTIVLAAPPGDGLRNAREHFTEYVKPVLVAGALDWDVIEGRKEGDVRAGVAERIRRWRRKHGESAETPLETDSTVLLEVMRERTGIQEYPGDKGDIVIGRNTWKEYVRGVHEGWLGPLDPPKQVEEEPSSSTDVASDSSATENSTSPQSEPLSISQADEASPTADAQEPGSSADEQMAAKPEDAKSEEAKPEATKPEDTKPDKPAKPSVPPPHNTPASYADSNLPRSCPRELAPSAPISFPHLLGVLNTPIRMYRFLTRRYVADEVGRQTAAAVLAAHRPYHHRKAGSPDPSAEEIIDDAAAAPSNEVWEQQELLAQAEADWAKKSRKRTEGEGERTFLDEMVIDPRVGSRMRKFELEPGEEERAKRIGKGAKGIAGRRPGDDGGLETDAES